MRKYIKDQISIQGECKNVAITQYSGDLMLYGRNGWAASGCPTGLTDALEELSNNWESIEDVHLTDNGEWLILFGDNGIVCSSGIPCDLEVQLQAWNSRGEVILSASFNDAGEWIAISGNYASVSSPRLVDWVIEGIEKYGEPLSCCVADDAMVVIYKYGFKAKGHIPHTLSETLQSTLLDVHRLKISDDSWFIADEDGVCTYYM